MLSQQKVMLLHALLELDYHGQITHGLLPVSIYSCRKITPLWYEPLAAGDRSILTPSSA